MALFEDRKSAPAIEHEGKGKKERMDGALGGTVTARRLIVRRQTLSTEKQQVEEKTFMLFSHFSGCKCPIFTESMGNKLYSLNLTAAPLMAKISISLWYG